MIGTSNIKSKHPGNIAPPKLQRIPKSDGTDAHLRIISKYSKSGTCPPPPPPPTSLPPVSQSEKKETAWFNKNDNEFLHSYDGSIPKPAQNIATMAGKKYIIIPKNNSMAVQPAITVKQDKIGDKIPALPVNSSTDNPSVPNEEISSQIAPIDEQLKKSASNNEGDNVVSMDSSNNQKDSPADDKVDDSKNIDPSNDAPKETVKPTNETSTPMEIDSNDISEKNLPLESNEPSKLPEVNNSGKKKLKKTVGKNRRGSQNKFLANGTSPKGAFMAQSSNIVDDRQSTAILNIARAGLK